MCGLFNDAVSISGYIVQNDRLISKYLVGKDVEDSDCGLIIGTVLPFAWRYWWELSKSSFEIVSNLDDGQAPCEYKLQVLPHEPTCLVSVLSWSDQENILTCGRWSNWAKELYNLYSSLNVIRIVKSRRVQYAKCFTWMEDAWNIRILEFSWKLMQRWALVLVMLKSEVLLSVLVP